MTLSYFGMISKPKGTVIFFKINASKVSKLQWVQTGERYCSTRINISHFQTES